jgi:hypothetical protein
VEQYVHIYGNSQQDDWVDLLPLAQFVHNSWPNASMKQTPFELLYGANPIIHLFGKSTNIPALNRRQEWLKEVRERTQESIENAQWLWLKQRQ